MMRVITTFEERVLKENVVTAAGVKKADMAEVAMAKTRRNRGVMSFNTNVSGTFTTNSLNVTTSNVTLPAGSLPATALSGLASIATSGAASNLSGVLATSNIPSLPASTINSGAFSVGSFGTSVTPSTDNTYSMGTSSNKWSSIFATAASFSNLTVSSNLTAAGTVAMLSNLSVSGPLTSGSHTPAASATYDLGSASNTWRNASLSGSLSAASGITSSNGLTVSSGTVSLPANSITSNAIASLDASKIISGTFGTGLFGSNNISTSGASTLGTVSCTTLLTNNSNVTVGTGSITSGSLIPTTNASYDLGASSSNWRNAYLSGAITATTYTNFPRKFWNATTNGFWNAAAGSLCKVASLLAIGNAANGGSVRLSGAIGGFGNNQSAIVDCMISSRGGYGVKGSANGYVTAAKGCADIVTYVESNGTFTIYVKVIATFVSWDLSVEGAGTNVTVLEPSNTIITSPTGTLNTPSVLSVLNVINESSTTTTSYNSFSFASNASDLTWAAQGSTSGGSVSCGPLSSTTVTSGQHNPTTNATYDLGSSSSNWRNAYCSGSISAASGLTSSNGLTVSAGTVSLPGSSVSTSAISNLAGFVASNAPGSSNIGVLATSNIPNLPASILTSGAFSVGSFATSVSASNATSSQFGLLSGATSNAAHFGLAGAPGNYSTSAVIGDAIVRSIGGNLMLQSGGGTAAIYINSNNAVGVGNSGPLAQLHNSGDMLVGANNSAWPTTATKGLYMRYSTNSGQNEAYIQSRDFSASNSPLYPLGICGSNIALGGISPLTSPTLYVAASGYVGLSTASPSCAVDFGTAGANKQLGLATQAGAWYGIGAANSAMQYQTGGAHTFYVGSTAASLGTSAMSISSSGALSTGAINTGSSNITSGQHNPSANATYDLGASGTAWKNAYLSGTLSASTFAGLPRKYWNANTQGVVNSAGGVYYKIATMVGFVGGNLSVLRVSGQMGGEGNTFFSTVDICIATRPSPFTAFGTIVGNPANTKTYVDVALYLETGGTYSVYIATAHQYANWDLAVEGGSGITLIEPTGSTTMPTGTLQTSSILGYVNSALDVGASRLALGGTVAPSSNSVYDVGTSALNWRNAYLSGTLSCGPLNAGTSYVTTIGAGSSNSSALSAYQVSAAATTPRIALLWPPGNNSGSIDFCYSNSTVMGTAASARILASDTIYSANLSFQTRTQANDSTTMNTWLYINGSNGQVGVNTTTPAYTMDVNGTFRAGASTLSSVSCSSLTTGAGQTVSLPGVVGVNDATDSGATRGLRLWSPTDPNWVSYVTQAGASKSSASGTTCASLDGRTAHHMRNRVNNSSVNGFIWENSAEQCLMSLTGDTGNLFLKGMLSASGTGGLMCTALSGGRSLGSFLTTGTLTGNANAPLYWSNIHALAPLANIFNGVISNYYIRVTGYINVQYAQQYTFYFNTQDDATYVFIDGALVIAQASFSGTQASANYTFATAGWKPIYIYHAQISGGEGLRLQWSTSGAATIAQQDIPGSSLAYDQGEVKGQSLGGPLFYNDTTYNVGIANTNPSCTLDVTGNVRATLGFKVSNTATHLQSTYGTYGFISYSDGSTYYQLATNSGDSGGGFNSLRPFYWNLANGNVSLANNQVTIAHSSGAMGCSTINASGTVNASTLYSTSFTAPATQGGYLAWNRANGSGQTCFANDRGNGGGGWEFVSYSTTNAFEQVAATIDSFGGLSCGSVTCKAISTQNSNISAGTGSITGGPITGTTGTFSGAVSTGGTISTTGVGSYDIGSPANKFGNLFTSYIYPTNFVTNLNPQTHNTYDVGVVGGNYWRNGYFSGALSATTYTGLPRKFWNAVTLGVQTTGAATKFYKIASIGNVGSGALGGSVRVSGVFGGFGGSQSATCDVTIAFRDNPLFAGSVYGNVSSARAQVDVVVYQDTAGSTTSAYSVYINPKGTFNQFDLSVESSQQGVTLVEPAGAQSVAATGAFVASMISAAGITTETSTATTSLGNYVYALNATSNAAGANLYTTTSNATGGSLACAAVSCSSLTTNNGNLDTGGGTVKVNNMSLSYGSGPLYMLTPSINVYGGGSINNGTFIINNSQQGTAFGTNQGGLGSYSGLSFKCMNDSTERHLFDTTTGNAVFKGSLSLGQSTVGSSALNVTGSISATGSLTAGAISGTTGTYSGAVSCAGLTSSSGLGVTSGSAGPISNMTTVLAASLGTGNYLLNDFGTAQSAYNCGYTGFFNQGGAGSTTNYASFGLYGYSIGSQTFNACGNGNFGLYTTTPSYTLDINGSARVQSNLLVTGTIGTSVARTGNVWINNANTGTITANGNTCDFGTITPTTAGSSGYCLGSAALPWADLYTSGKHYATGNCGMTANSTTTFTPAAPFHMSAVNDSNGNTMIVGVSTVGCGIVFDDIAKAKWRLATGGFCMNFQQHTSATATDYTTGSFSTRVYFDSNSAVHATGGLITTSDSNIKTKIVPLTNALDRLCQLSGKSFDYKHPESHNGQSNACGFIAQEVREVFPDWVVTCPQPDEREAQELGDEPLLGLNISNSFYAHVVESIKELKREKDELKASVASLTARLVALESN